MYLEITNHWIQYTYSHKNTFGTKQSNKHDSFTMDRRTEYLSCVLYYLIIKFKK